MARKSRKNTLPEEDQPVAAYRSAVYIRLSVEDSQKKLLTGGWNHVRLDLPRLSVDELDAINELLAHGRRVILSPGEDFVDIIAKGILSQRIT